MLNIIQKYISRIITQEVPVKMPFDIVAYFFKENIERNFRGNAEIVDRSFNPLEEICKKQDFSFGPLITNAHIKPNVMKQREYFMKVEGNLVLLENLVDIYFLGEKNTSICFPEGQEDEVLLNEFQKHYLEEPKKMITDLKTGGLVLYRGEKRFILTEKQINEAFGEAFEKYRIMR